MCTEYYRGLLWSLKYYNNSLPSWTYIYKYHYGPFASDLCVYMQESGEFELGEPLTPFQALICCLPPGSAHALPAVYQHLLKDSTSPLAFYSQRRFLSDQNGKEKEFESVIILPFIPDEVLANVFEEMSRCTLSDREKQLNSRDDLKLFLPSDEEVKVVSPLKESVYPSISCRIRIQTITDLTTVHQYICTKPHNQPSKFPSIFPLCTGIVHDCHPPDGIDPMETVLEPTLLEIDQSESPKVPSKNEIKELGEKYCDKIVEYGFCSTSYGYVSAVYSTSFSSLVNKEKSKGDPDRVVTVTTANLDVNQVLPDIILQCQTNAYHKADTDSFERGYSLIFKNTVLVSLKPVVGFTRNPSSGEVLPLFSTFEIYYPLCFIHKIDHISYPIPAEIHELSVGEEVVLLSSLKVNGKSIMGCAGTVKKVSNDILTVTTKLPDEVKVPFIMTSTWYTLKQVICMVPSCFSTITNFCLKNYWFNDDGKKVRFTLDLIPNRRYCRMGLVKMKETENDQVPVDTFSRIGVITTHRKKQEYVFSRKAVDLIEEYFRQFGSVLLKGLEPGMNNYVKVNYTIINKQFCYKVNHWLESNVFTYSMINKNCVYPPEHFVSTLLDTPVNRNDQIVEVECVKTNVLSRDSQACIQPMSCSQPITSYKIGSRVVIVNHPTIPFGARGTVISIDVQDLFLEVILDHPTYAGVCKEVNNNRESLGVGRNVTVHKKFCILVDK